MSQRKVVVASDIGGLSEAVVDGETGILVPPNNIHKLSEASSYLLENPEVASTMGENGYKRFLENYTADAVIPRIIEVYQSLLLNKGQTV
jgi:glycosyltransferase involved in cell wall biosynthesis